MFTPLAERQVDELYGYIASRASERDADAYIGRIPEYWHHFETFPERGTRRDGILPGLRTVGFERRLTIAFVVSSDAVLIEGIVYAGQDFVTALTDKSPAGENG